MVSFIKRDCFTLNGKYNIKAETESSKLGPVQLLVLLQSYSSQNSVVQGLRQANRLTKENKEFRKIPIHIQTINF